MPEPRPNILVVGGNSRVGRALVQRLGQPARAVVRGGKQSDCDIVVEDYAAIPPSVFSTVDLVVNCVGISVGDEGELQRVNVDIPCSVAAMAKACGARKFLHVSSFSVYGNALVIDRETPEAPVSAYGKSKLTADRALSHMDGPDFGVTILRLPLIYSPTAPGKLGQLIRWSRSLRFMAVPSGDVRRSMIGVDLAVDVIARCLELPATGVVLAADPAAFTYARAAAVTAPPMRCLPVPGMITRAVQRVAPAIGQRLFADSWLSDRDNLAVRHSLASRLYGDIATISSR